MHAGDYHNRTRVEWVLDVPDDEILSIVDDHIWNRIIGRRTNPPRSLYHEWRDKAPADMEPAAYDAYIEQKEEEYHSQPPPEGGWWSALFIPDATIEGATVLLKYPIPESWVVSDGRGRG